MIKKERLQELIEQNAIVYYVANEFWDNSGNMKIIEHKLTKTRVKDLGGIEEISFDKRFFETKEEAEWHKENYTIACRKAKALFLGELI